MANASQHLTYPSSSSTPPPTLPASAPIVPPPKPEVLSDRLYVGNLHPTVDESGLLKIFSKCGKVSRLDYLFHKSGPAKGKPRGYAFVEFSDPKGAKKAVDMLHDRVIRGRKLIVSFATQSSHPTTSSSLATSSHIGPMRRRHDDVNKPTTLSLIKTPTGRQASSRKSTESKIAAMEAKLKQLREQPPTGAVSGSGGLASLPRKPPPTTSRRQ